MPVNVINGPKRDSLSTEGGVMKGDIDMNGYKISNVGNPTSGGDVVTKEYLENNPPNINELPGILSISKGGTEASTKRAALNNLEGMPIISSIFEQSLDEIIESFALVDLRLTENEQLHSIIQGNYAYVITLFFAAQSTSSSRMQLAIGYNTRAMAMRTYYEHDGTWLDWNEIILSSNQYSKINNAYYWGIKLPDNTESGYLRAPTNGIIPNTGSAAGVGSLGTSSWMWANVYTNAINGYDPWHKGNLLYQTGTWTPTLSTIQGTKPTVSYDERNGRYIRFGPFCFIEFRINANITAVGGSSDWASITGLPYAGTGYYQSIHFSENGMQTSGTYGENNGFIYGSIIRIQSTSGTGAVYWKTGRNYIAASAIYEIN